MRKQASDTERRGMSMAKTKGQIKYHGWTNVVPNANKVNMVIKQPFSILEKSLEESHRA